MRRRLSAWSRVFLVTVGTSVAGLVAGVLVVEKFPWQTVYTDFSVARVSQFLTPWPMSAMEEELQERKRLRRFAKQEVERRFGIQLRRMENLSTPLFDPFLDVGVQILQSLDATAPQPNLHFPWPGLETVRVSGDPGVAKKVTYFTAASPHGVQLIEGISIGSGEEIRLTFPIVRNRRTLEFVALPLSPGTVRGLLGQYSWVRTFSESDVNRFQNISIPLNDATASTLRIVSQSAHFLFLNASVSQWDRAGRLPVQVSNRSPIWKEDPQLLRKPNEVSAVESRLEAEQDSKRTEALEETRGEDEGARENLEAPVEEFAKEGAKDGANEGAKDGAQEVSPGGAKETAQGFAKEGSKEAASALIDPMEETANLQVISASERTAAVGYNILLLQTGELPEALISNLKMLAPLAPNLTELLAVSVRTQASPVAQETANDIFQRTVLATGTDGAATNTPLLLKKYLEDPSGFNLYARLRNFGYKVVALAPAPFLGLPDTLANGREVPALERRWLGALDWPFAQRNKELDEQNQPVTGLDAIFQTNTTPLAPPLTDADLQKMGAFLGVVGKVQAAFPDWRVNELFLPDSEGVYLPAAVDFIQNWSKQNTQARFFLHAHLDPTLGQTRPSMKDLFQVAKAKRFFGMTSSKETENLAQLVLLDRAIGQIMSTFKARKLTHRTLVGLMIPHGTKSGESRMTAALHIPGVVPRTGVLPPAQSANVDDLVATMVTAVGIPLGRRLPDSVAVFPGLSWELPRVSQRNAASSMALEQVEDENASALKRYVVYLRSGNTGCSPLKWRTDEDVFGFESSHPVVEFPASSRRQHFEIFPCALPGSLVRLSWYQRRPSSSLGTPLGNVGGSGSVSATPPDNTTGMVSGLGASLGTGSSPGGALGVAGNQTSGASSAPAPSRVEAAAMRAREREQARLAEERERDGVSLATLRGYFALGSQGEAAGLEERALALPLFFFGRNALRLGALPMTLARLSEREVSRVFDVEENEVPDLKLARDILDLSEFNEGVDREGAFGDVKQANQVRSALLVFRHSVRPHSQAVLRSAVKMREGARR